MENEKKNDTDKLMNRWTMFFGTIITCVLIIAFRFMNHFINKVASFTGLDVNIIIVLILLGIVALVYFSARKREVLTQTLTAFFLGVGQYIAIVMLYYGKIHSILLAHLGIEPRAILFVQTLFFIIVAGVVWYGVLAVYKVTPNIWKAYTFISTIGPILIAGMMWAQPYDLFEHLPKDKNGKKAVNADGNYEVRAKFWILRDKASGKIIDCNYSPGISKKYGKQLKKGTPDDVKDVEEYLGMNSKIPFLYNQDSWKKGFSITKLTANTYKVTFFTDKPVSVMQIKQGGTFVVTEVSNPEKVTEYFKSNNEEWPVEIGKTLSASINVELTYKAQKGEYLIIKSDYALI